MANTINTRIALKSDLSAKWESSDLIALNGEYMFDSERRYIKVGDGVHKWSELSTIRLPKEAVDNLKDVDTNTLYRFDPNLVSGDTISLVSADGTASTIVWDTDNPVCTFKVDLSSQISSIANAYMDIEKGRAEAAEGVLRQAVAANTTAIEAEVTRAKAAEAKISGDLGKEAETREAADKVLSDAIDVLNGADTTAGSVAKSIKDAIEALDVEPLTGTVAQTITSISEVDGKISATYNAITIDQAHVTGLTDALDAKTDVSAFNAAAKAFEDSISTLDGRLDVIEGDGEGSIKKALQDAKGYADDQDAEVSAATLEAAKDYADTLSSALSTTVVADYVKYADVKGGKAALENENKIATIADIAGLSGAVHFRGAFANDPTVDGGKSDKQAFFDTFKPIDKGDIAINTTNGKEYLAISALEEGATAEQINAGIVELGDEGLYVQKSFLLNSHALTGTALDLVGSDIKVKDGIYAGKNVDEALAQVSADAKAYTDAEIQKLDFAELTVGADKTLASIKQEDGKISATSVSIQIAESQVTGLDDHFEVLSGLVKTEAEDRDAAISAAIMALDVTDTEEAGKFVTAVSETDGKISVLRAALVSSDIPVISQEKVDGLADAIADAEKNAKDYTDEVSAALSTDYVAKIGEAKTELIGTSGDLSAADTIWGAKKYAENVAASVEVNALTGVTLNNQDFTVTDHVASLEISAIICGGAD